MSTPSRALLVSAKLIRAFLAACALWCVAFSLPAATMTLHVDLREAPRGLLHARLGIPVKPGALTLVYPRWIPGWHGPTGPVADLAGLEFSPAGRPLAWRCDLENMMDHPNIAKVHDAGATGTGSNWSTVSPGRGRFRAASGQLRCSRMSQLRHARARADGRPLQGGAIEAAAGGERVRRPLPLRNGPSCDPHGGGDFFASR